jgi:hypothetical protein
LKNPLLFFPSRRQNDREQASKTEMRKRERDRERKVEREVAYLSALTRR